MFGFALDGRLGVRSEAVSSLFFELDDEMGESKKLLNGVPLHMNESHQFIRLSRESHSLSAQRPERAAFPGF
jgi:hypothetical protein